MYNSYWIVMTMELGSIGIKYQGSGSGSGSGTNPFEHSTPSMLLFLTAVLCHAVASAADMNLATTVIIFHVSGVVGCETLLWILLPESWSWYLIINALVLLLVTLCFFNSIRKLRQQYDRVSIVLSQYFSPNAENVPNLELHQEAQV